MQPKAEPAPDVDMYATGPPEDDDDSSGISDDSDHETDPEDVDIDMNDDPLFNTFQNEMADSATTIGTYVTGTTNQAMRNLNTAVKVREKRRKDRRRARKAGRAGRAGRVVRNREERPRPVTATGGTAVQTGPGIGRATAHPVEHENTPVDEVPHLDTPPEIESEEETQEEIEVIPSPPKPVTQPVIKLVPKPVSKPATGTETKPPKTRQDSVKPRISVDKKTRRNPVGPVVTERAKNPDHSP